MQPVTKAVPLPLKALRVPPPHTHLTGGPGCVDARLGEVGGEAALVVADAAHVVVRAKDVAAHAANVRCLGARCLTPEREPPRPMLRVAQRLSRLARATIVICLQRRFTLEAFDPNVLE